MKDDEVTTRGKRGALSIFFSSQSLRDRFFFTLVGVAVYRLGLQIPIPGVDPHLAFYQHELARKGLAGELPSFTLFSLGIFPLLNASAFVLLGSFFMPSLRRLRDGSAEDQERLNLIIYITTALFSGIVAWGRAVSLESMYVAGTPLVSGGFGFRMTCVAALTAGTMFLVWLANQVTRRGLVNGIALFIVAGMLSRFLPFLSRILSSDALTRFETLLLLVVPFALLILSTGLILARRPIPLERSTAMEGVSPNAANAVEIPIRVMGAGVVSVFGANRTWEVVRALLVLAFPGLVLPAYTSPLYLILFGLTVLILAYLLTAATYDAEDIIARIRAFGYRISGCESEGEMRDYVDRTVARTILPGALVLTFAALLPAILYVAFRVYGDTFVGYEMFMLAGIGVSLVQTVESHRRMDSGAKNDEEGAVTVWRKIISSDTDLEADLICARLSDAGIPAYIYSTRIMNALGTLGLWETCKPRFPMNIIYRRLGNGSVDVFVPSDHFDQARGILIECELSPFEAEPEEADDLGNGSSDDSDSYASTKTAE